MQRRQLLQAASAAIALPGLALAQSYPTRSIRYIVPVAAGGGNDMIARVVTERWGAMLGQAFVVDNQSGGGGVVASTMTARATPDGYTLMQGYVATHGTTPATRRVSYDAVKQFTPIGMIGATPNVLVVNASVPARTVKEFIDYVKREPNKISYGSAGQGSLTHLTMELMKQETGMDILHTPYRGIAPAINDLLGGQTQAMFPGLAAALPHLRGGKMRALAVTGKARSPQLKDVPTMEEVGFKGFDAMQWYGSVGPAGMSADVVKILNDSQVAVLKSPDMRDKLAGEAVEPWPMTPAEFGEYIRADIARWTALAKARNIQLEE
jgi:tripartite-type tricarboxylate transporter receptor subunit TctC